MLPPRQHPRSSGPQTSLSLASSDPAASPDTQEPGSNSDQGQDSPTESASSRETWPIETNHPDAVGGHKIEKEKEGENEVAELQVIRRVSNANRLSLHEIARDRVDVVAEKIKVMPDELLEELKGELRQILEGTGGSHHIEEFLYLQKLVQGRVDLTAKSLAGAHRVQLEILVAINSGIQAFLHPSVSIPQSRLIEVFLYKRCRNIACQSALPADECSCEICTSRNGFCNLCMCVICNKFDFEVNTCRWIGCDTCTHWTHTDCAMRVGQIGTGQSVKSGVGHTEMLFRCQACHRTSELLGWVKDVFQQCVPGWDREILMRELDFVKLELDSPKNSENEEVGRLISPQEACNKIAEVVQEAVRKMEMVAEEKMRMFKRARLALDACDRELEDKAREVQELKMERQRKKQQVEELESIIRLKQAEAEMFQLKANEAKQEADRLQSIAQAKSEKAEQDYASMYLKRRLEEAEAEKQYLYEKIKLQESQHAPQGNSSGGCSDPAQTIMLNKIQDLLKNVRSMPPKTEGQ
ncbi:hypothetical protein MUK42_20090 [Musa troglodytarum]|uniref:OBERON-like protein n=1 Tax=Musa troglodytarum TaxID=320322 RepID=A0A9E7H4G2_9LILI|nr:hypothetical protein MUK42_20090 [Musa troglodytarum]